MDYLVVTPDEAIVIELTERIVAQIPQHPEILTMENYEEVLNIKELKINELQPSLNQVSMALKSAKKRSNGDKK